MEGVLRPAGAVQIKKDEREIIQEVASRDPKDKMGPVHSSMDWMYCLIMVLSSGYCSSKWCTEKATILVTSTPVAILKWPSVFSVAESNRTCMRLLWLLLSKARSFCRMSGNSGGALLAALSMCPRN